jgi:hypothetical protein
MKITIDGEEQPVGQKIERRIRLRGQPKRPVEGAALDEKAATKRYKRSLWWTYGIIYPALLLGWFLSMGKAQNGGVILFTFLFVLAFAFLIAYFHRRDIRRWRERSAGRLADLPAVGTKISVSPDALSVEGASYPWSALSVAGVDFELKRAKRSAWLEVDRIRVLANDGKSFVLDTFGYTNGAKLVDMAADKLWPQVQPVVNGESSASA